MSLITDILKNHRTFAVVGVSQDPAKYGHEIFEALLAKGYIVYPINPKYESVDRQPSSKPWRWKPTSSPPRMLK